LTAEASPRRHEVKSRLLEVAEALEARAAWTHRSSTGEGYVRESKVVRDAIGLIVQLETKIQVDGEHLALAEETIEAIRPYDVFPTAAQVVADYNTARAALS
jgi:crotonobetainyl-CoA:carnitine CoA-transferase CaiB-like acyl-CoA transferase